MVFCYRFAMLPYTAASLIVTCMAMGLVGCWVVQNDLQAMARCHRIGQAKEVTIYRLVCRDTYEAQIFQTSSRKYGTLPACLVP